MNQFQIGTKSYESQTVCINFRKTHLPHRFLNDISYISSYAYHSPYFSLCLDFTLLKVLCFVIYCYSLHTLSPKKVSYFPCLTSLIKHRQKKVNIKIATRRFLSHMCAFIISSFILGFAMLLALKILFCLSADLQTESYPKISTI